MDPAYLPAELMAKFAGLATDREVSEAAAYFSSRALRRPRAQVIEADRVPRIHAEAWVYVTPGGGGNEPLGVRLIELPRDFARHELRDSQAEYVACVPPGSIERGRKLAMDADLVRPSCASCHGADLRGVALVPPIAGRSPTYLLRPLVAFRTGAPMKPVADQLVLKDMIAVAAYAGSVQP